MRRVIKRGGAESAEGSAEEKRFTAKPQRAQRNAEEDGFWVLRRVIKRGGAEGARRRRGLPQSRGERKGEREGEEVYRKAAKGAEGAQRRRGLPQSRGDRKGSRRGRPRNFLSVKVFRMDLEADFKRLFVVGFGC